MQTTIDSRNRLVLQIFGELAEDDLTSLRDLLEQHGRAPHLVVDLSEVSYLCSLALAAHVAAIRRARSEGRELTVRARRGTIAERVLAVSAMPYEAFDANAEQAATSYR